MELRGKLDTFPLSDVLGFIEEKGHTGYLGLRLDFGDNHYTRRLLGSGFEERLLIERGRLHGLASLRSPETWCRLLVRGEMIPRTEEKVLRERLESLGELLLQTLTGALDMEGGALRERMELYLRERVGWLFLAHGGDFWFEFEGPGAMPSGWQAVPLGELVQHGPEYAQMLEGLITRCPEPWARIRVIPPGPDTPPPDSLLRGEWETLARVNGRRSIEDLLRHSRLAVYDTAAHLLSLQDHGYIDFAPEMAPKERICAKLGNREPKGSRIGRLRDLFQVSRPADALPQGLIGRTCLLVNRVIGQAGDQVLDLEEAWREILHTHPLASALNLGAKGFDPAEFDTRVRTWGGHAQDWAEIEAETRDALNTLLRQFYHDLVVVGDKKRAESILRRAWHDFPADDAGIPKLEDLEAMLPAA